MNQRPGIDRQGVRRMGDGMVSDGIFEQWGGHGWRSRGEPGREEAVDVEDLAAEVDADRRTSDEVRDPRGQGAPSSRPGSVHNPPSEDTLLRAMPSADRIQIRNC
jgi:hypothetical protein